MPDRYWTPADDAELAVLVYEFVNGVCEHRDRCGVCSAGDDWCGPLRDALEVIIDWRRGRILHNKARVLRALQERAEQASFIHENIPALEVVA